MVIKVKRKAGAIRINRISIADHPSIEFADSEDVFEIPIQYLVELSEYFEPYFPVGTQEKKASDFMLGVGSKKFK